MAATDPIWLRKRWTRKAKSIFRAARKALSPKRARPFRVCIQCGEMPLLPTQHRYCSPGCARLQRYPTTRCKKCGVAIKRMRRFCSSCVTARRAQQNKNKRRTLATCARCGRHYLATVRNARTKGYCSARCQKPRRKLIPCPRCGAEFWPWSNGSHARKFCCKVIKKAKQRGPRKQAAPRRAKPCRWCRREFLSFERYCSKECRRQATNQRKHLRRRGMRRRQDLIPLSEIYQRDRGICGLCHRRVSLKYKPNHPKSATIDHIIPVHPSKGGRHTRDNVQLAHFGCNSSKRHRVRGQMRMF